MINQELTGIRQEQVDSAPLLEDVLLSFNRWVKSHDLVFAHGPGDEVAMAVIQGELSDGDESGLPTTQQSSGSQPSQPPLPKTFALATDGPWDLNHFLGEECKRVGGTLGEWHAQQPYLHAWVNLRWLHSAFYRQPRMGIEQCLKFHKLKFVGRPHSGIDDSRNIARIASILLKDGCVMPLNDGLAEEVAVSWRWGPRWMRQRKEGTTSKGLAAARARRAAGQ
jgi:inhibitor of KinA sporulation pathway (predicted exonuclease)